MNSYALTEATTLSCKNVMRAAIYKELKKLSNIYLFDPRWCGFVDILVDDNYTVILRGYTWDVKNDRLRNPQGKKIKLPLKLESVSPEIISIRWESCLNWPKDVYDPDAGWIVEEEGQEDADLKGGSNDNPLDPDDNLQVGGDSIPQEKNLDLQVEDNLVTPPEETTNTTTGTEAEASREEPVVDVEGNIGDELHLSILLFFKWID